MVNENIVSSLYNLNTLINSWKENLPEINILRERFLEKGQFINLINLSKKEINTIVEAGKIVAVDGSRVEFGSFFPYYICLLKTLAKSTGYFDGEKHVDDFLALTPLDHKVFKEIEKSSIDNKISIDESYRNYLKENLARMELKTALTTIKKFNPSLIILDGGFLLFDKYPEWEELYQECIDKDIILVGLIEEIATSELAKWFNITVANRPRIYDRELLFGLFNQGEYINFHTGNRIKKDYCTVFGRLSSSPQAIACDFLPEQEHYVSNTMHLLYSLTPKQGQGIPIWLQIVDAEVRLRKKEVDKLISTCIDSDTYQRYFKPNRENRIY
ncbi:hypothetical protein SYNTR_0671 [Candidatus Syntrophocurvum alkaliphilum]|uniref:NurA domain-containing protein n=1 Tax=Candidatus Syntrophocurvum alkaliphilum TaxID=2293317 RepID=A0A6I6DD58_9FIRM|nr:DNA double-strand break repair nuclease NurA [Candidatus Syntrophocurvum alkaliphilum]QGT99264.1 hypothetical protein SYNTR_0671 [Candidatus Syntrophocurvum alkaliphilum]